jgi:hypothetical protein
VVVGARTCALLLLERRSAMRARTAALNQLSAERALATLLAEVAPELLTKEKLHVA